MFFVLRKAKNDKRGTGSPFQGITQKERSMLKMNKILLASAITMSMVSFVHAATPPFNSVPGVAKSEATAEAEAVKGKKVGDRCMVASKPECNSPDKCVVRKKLIADISQCPVKEPVKIATRDEVLALARVLDAEKSQLEALKTELTSNALRLGGQAHAGQENIRKLENLGKDTKRAIDFQKNEMASRQSDLDKTLADILQAQKKIENAQKAFDDANAAYESDLKARIQQNKDQEDADRAARIASGESKPLPENNLATPKVPTQKEIDALIKILDAKNVALEDAKALTQRLFTESDNERASLNATIKRGGNVELSAQRTQNALDKYHQSQMDLANADREVQEAQAALNAAVAAKGAADSKN